MIRSSWILPRFGALTLLLGTALLWPTFAHEGEDHDTQLPGLAEECLAVTNLTASVDPLPIPAVAVPVRTDAQFRLPWDPSIMFEHMPGYDLTLTSVQNRFHRDLPSVEVWGYGGTDPGLTTRAITNTPILVNWTNACRFSTPRGFRPTPTSTG